MKNCWRAWCVFCLTLSLLICFTVEKAEADDSQDSDLRVLRVGYVPGTGFLEEDRPGHMLGNGYEYMEFLAQYGGWKFEYVACGNWWECGEKLESGEIDLLPAMPGNYKSLPFAVRTDHVIARFPMELVVQERLERDFLKLGTLDYNYPIPSLPDVARAEGFGYELKEYHDFTEMQQDFRQGLLDGYVGPMLHSEKEDKVLSIFNRVTYRLLVKKERTELLAKVNLAMEQMLLNQPNLREWLDSRYQRSQGFPLILNKREREYLRDREKLTMAVLLREKPYCYLEGGAWKGLIPDLAAQISEDLGVEVEILDIDSLDELKRMIARGSVDFVADVPCDFSWLKEFGLAPTQAYMDINYVPVMRRGSVGMADPRVAVIRDMLHTKNYEEQRFPEKQLKYYDTLPQCFQAVGSGKADMIYAPRAVVPYLMEEAGTYNLEADTESRFSEAISIGVWKQSDPMLWQILNKEISHFPPNLTRDAMSRVAKDTSYHLSPAWLIYHYPLHAAIVILLLMSAALGIVWYRARMRRQHMETVQQLAYTDLRYMMPNMLWLEQEMPKLFQQAGEMPDHQMYSIVFAMESKASLAAMYGRDLLDKQLKETSEHLRQRDWVLTTAAGMNAGRLVCICVAKGDAEIQTFAAEAVREYGYLETADARISLHMRAGICGLKQGDSLSEMVERADTACNEEQGGSSPVRLFDKDMEDRLVLQQRIEAYMEKALKKGEFQAWYQPKYDIRTRRIVGAEALVRWQSAELGFMPPGKFIPIFEQNGFVIPIDYVLLEKTFALQKRRLEEGKETVPISVNQSRLHITEEGYLERMKAIVEKYRLPKGMVELEITETMFGDFDEKAHRENATQIMHELHRMGFSLSVDDFGSGFSSFTMLDYMPMDVMKIDRSLLVASDHSQRMQDILGNVIRLGQTLHMKVLCEGIETEEQEQLLLKLGCHYGQGYLNAKPMPEKEFIDFLEKRIREVGSYRENG